MVDYKDSCVVCVPHPVSLSLPEKKNHVAHSGTIDSIQTHHL